MTEYLSKTFKSNLKSVVLVSSNAIYYDQFDNPASLGRCIIKSGSWRVSDGYLCSESTDQNVLQYLGDFPKEANIEFKFKIESNCESYLHLLTESGASGAKITIDSGSNRLNVEPGKYNGPVWQGVAVSLDSRPEWELDETFSLQVSWSAGKNAQVHLNGNPVGSVGMGAVVTGFEIKTIGGTMKIKSIRVLTSESPYVRLIGLSKGETAVIENEDGSTVHPMGTTTDGEVSFLVKNPSRGRFVVKSTADKVGSIGTCTNIIIGGDIFELRSVNTHQFMKECEDKLFSTFWIENSAKGGVIGRIGEHATFIESTEFAYFYKLLPEFLITGDAKILDKIDKLRNFIFALRENRPSSQSYGLFYERMVLEKEERDEQSVRGINQGVAGRYLAFDYVMTGNKASLQYLVQLLDSLIRVGMVDGGSGELHLYDPSKGKLSTDTDVKNSYLLDAFTMGYCLTGKKEYLDVAINTCDWLINTNIDSASGTFPGTSTHDTMEFLEAVWNVYLISKERKYLKIVDRCISSYLQMRYRWGGIPFRHFGKEPTHSVDVLTIAQMFLGIKLHIWNGGSDDMQKEIEQMAIYLHSARIEKQQSTLNSSTKSLGTRLLYKKKGWKWNAQFWDKSNLWNFRHSTITKNEVYESWAPTGNVGSFIISYLTMTMLSLSYGAFIGFQGRYHPGQPLVLFSDAALSDFESSPNTASFRIDRAGESNMIVFVPASSSHNVDFKSSTSLEKKELSASGYGQVIAIRSAGPSTLKMSW